MTTTEKKAWSTPSIEELGIDQTLSGGAPGNTEVLIFVGGTNNRFGTIPGTVDVRPPPR